MSEALNIIKDPTLTYNQELIALAKLGNDAGIYGCAKLVLD